MAVVKIMVEYDTEKQVVTKIDSDKEYFKSLQCVLATLEQAVDATKFDLQLMRGQALQRAAMEQAQAQQVAAQVQRRPLIH